MVRPIYIIGHKNPDSDSVVSAIALANLKRLDNINAQARIVSDANNETKFLLKKFGFEVPSLMYSARCMLKDIEHDSAIIVKKDVTMKEALDKSLSMKNKGVIVVDDDYHLLGVVSMSDLTSLWTFDEKALSKLMSKVKFSNIVKTLKGKIYHEVENMRTSGDIQLLPSLTNSLTVMKDSIVIVGNNPDVQRSVILNKASCLVVCGEDWVDNVTLDLAKQHGVCVLYTPLSALTCSQVIFQSTSIDEIMTSDVISFHDHEYVEDVVSKMAKTRYRMYPLLDEDKLVIGSISRYHLFNYQKKQFILVDHNEYSQSIKDLEYGEIVEIIDHHRLGGIETSSPISITSMPVGSSATIVTRMYREHHKSLEKNMAGLLLGAIISDTLCLKSPTTTPMDVECVKYLEELSGYKMEDLSKEMLDASDSVTNKPYLELLYDDFKEFRVDEHKFAIGQSACRTKEEYLKVKEGFKKYLEEICDHQGYDLILFLFTDPLGSGSYFLAAGKKAEAIKEGFKNQMEDDFAKDIISRKKQVLPVVTTLIKE